MYSFGGKVTLFLEVDHLSLSSDQSLAQLSLLLLLFRSLALQAGDTLLVDCQFAFNTLYNLVGMAIRFTRLANPGLCASSSGTQGLSLLTGVLQRLPHFLHILRPLRS